MDSGKTNPTGFSKKMEMNPATIVSINQGAVKLEFLQEMKRTFLRAEVTLIHASENISKLRRSLKDADLLCKAKNRESNSSVFKPRLTLWKKNMDQMWKVN